jgi:glucan phosphoethanolaminetransferase (alkaline phosphatase superfamily)
MLVWFSDNFEKTYPLKINQMKSKRQDSITTDFLFHSILDLGDLKNFKYLQHKSIFN